MNADLVSDQIFTNYDFSFEWKISEAGNRGGFINLKEAPEFSNTWKQLIVGSKLGNFPSFGKANQGKIAFQDWSKGVALRNIKIKETQ